MMPFEIARFLALNGLGIFSEIDGNLAGQGTIYIGMMPDDPDDLILINQYAGRQSTHKDLGKIQRPGLQIKCRAKYYEDAYIKAEQVNELLDQYQGRIDSKYYQWVRAIQSPFLLEQDANERIVFCQNFYIDRRSND